MAVRFHALLLNAKQIMKLQSLLTKKQEAVPKGYIRVYVGDDYEADKNRYVVPLSCSQEAIFNMPSAYIASMLI